MDEEPIEVDETATRRAMRRAMEAPEEEGEACCLLMVVYDVMSWWKVLWSGRVGAWCDSLLLFCCVLGLFAGLFAGLLCLLFGLAPGWFCELSKMAIDGYGPSKYHTRKGQAWLLDFEFA